jgi:hypothetical protein
MKKHELGDAPIEPEFVRMMNSIAHVLDEAFNGDAKGTDRKTGFVLIIFPFDEAEAAKAGGTGRANYISNASRDDVVIMLKEQIKRFEGQPEASGRA